MAELRAAPGALVPFGRSYLPFVFIVTHLAFPAGARGGWVFPIIGAHLNGTAQSRDESGAAKAEFGSMMNEKLAQDLLAFGGQREKDLTTIIARAMAAHIPARGQTVHQLNRAVMLNLQALRQLADSWANILGQTFNG